MVYGFDATRPEHGVDIDLYGSHDVPRTFAEATLRLNRKSTPEEVARFYQRGVLCGTVSAALRRAGSSPESNTTYREYVARQGYPDTFGLTASSPLHQGIVVNSPLPRQMALKPRMVYHWCQIGVHLQAAFRLRRAIRQGASEAEAAVDPERGKLHWYRRLPGESAQEQLRRAAEAIDRARSRRTKQDDLEALDMWSGLVDGRWTLVESFEGGGKRLFLAYPNELGLPNLRALSARERQVVAYVVQGDANKWIAYQLGIGEATVARHLSTALRKLGLRHRHELIWFYHSLRQGVQRDATTPKDAASAGNRSRKWE
jgi:DNA-binding CsgD family transcriptional regulator